MDHPSPHMVGLLDAIEQTCDISSQVVYFRPGAPERTWGNPPGLLPYRIAAGSIRSSALLNISKVLREMKSVRADIWIVNSCYTAPETWAAIRQLNGLNIPWVYMNEPVRMYGVGDGLKQKCLSAMLARADGVVGMGVKARDQYRKITRDLLPATSVPYQPGLNDFFELAPPGKTRQTAPTRFLIAAQFIHRKGFDILLSACAQLPTDGWTLTIAGEGKLRSKFEQAFAARFSNSKVQFVGQVSYADRAKLFEGHHVFVFPSRWDGWGMAPIEAMAAGLPVISSDQVMSMLEFIRDGENGYIVPSENAGELAAKMREFIVDPDRIPKMGLAARAALSGYTPEVGAERLVSFIRNVSQTNSKSARLYGKEHSSPPNPLTWRYLTEPTAIRKKLHKRVRSAAKRAVIDFALALRPKFTARGNRILVYHLVLHEDRARFNEHLSFLKDHYQIVPASVLAKNRCEASTAPLLSITFDDGFRALMLDAINLVERHNMKATFYVPTAHIELSSEADRAATFSTRAHYYEHPLEPMSPDDLRQLARAGHEIGSHGVSHIGLNALSHRGAVCELEQSQRQLASWIGSPVTGFAYPYGDTHNNIGNVPEWVRLAGYDYAVTLKRGAVNGDSDPMLLPREHAEGNWRVKDLAYFLGR
jgi:Glycosyltransferase